MTNSPRLEAFFSVLLEEAGKPGAAVLAGGTTLVDLMRADLMRPTHVVDIGHVPGLGDVGASGAELRFGALSRMADVAEHATLLRDYPVLTESLKLAASQQIRNAASLGGNLLQRTRCPYFRSGTSPCNKLFPGSGCAARDGDDREMALFGTSDLCVANHPGDFGTALAAFDASVELRSTRGPRVVPLEDLFLPYGDEPARETSMQHGEILTAIRVKANAAGRKSTYLKVRDRESYAYAVVSAAVALEMNGEPVTAARVSVGGVASKPWRARSAEEALVGRVLTPAVALEAGGAAFAGSRPLRHNAFKVELGGRAVARATMMARQRG